MTVTGDDGEHEKLAELRKRLAMNPRLGGHFRVDRCTLEADGVLIVEAEVADVAQKKTVLEICAAFPGIDGIVDRIRVRPASPMKDAEIRAHLRTALGEDPVLAGLDITEIRGHKRLAVASIAGAHGWLDYEVVDGVVTLNGQVPGLVTKRYVGALAWWIPGTRDVVNGISVPAGEEDSADSIAEAVEVILGKDPYVDASQVKIGVRGRTVRLTGLLASQAQKRMAENDAWCVFGVDDVINEIAVGP